jgi:hypothetical protein
LWRTPARGSPQKIGIIFARNRLKEVHHDHAKNY